MSMVLSGIPDVQSQLDSLQRLLREKASDLQEKNSRIADLEGELREIRSRYTSLEAGMVELRATLTPLYHGLQLVFGQIEASGVQQGVASTAAVPTRKHEAWESWKQKLKGKASEAIDVLLLHGSMTRPQLRLQLACGWTTVDKVISTLENAKLISKANRQITLKEL